MHSVRDWTISEFGGPSTSSENVTKRLVFERSSFALTSLFRGYLVFRVRKTPLSPRNLGQMPPVVASQGQCCKMLTFRIPRPRVTRICNV